MNFFQTAIFLIILVFTHSIFAQDESRASKTWEVQKYDLAVTLPAAETDRFINVKANLDLRNVGGNAASRLTLRISPNAEIAAIRINGAPAEFTKGEEKIGGNQNLQRVILRTPAAAPNANLSVAVDYKLKVEENSGLGALSMSGSQLLPLSFWYPTPNSWYFARGGDFAPVRLQVNSVNGQKFIAPGNESANSFDLKLNGQPFFVTGDWDAANENGVTVYLPKGSDADAQKRAAEIAALASEAKTFTANLLGPAPDAPLRLAAVKRGAGFSSGGVVLIDENVFKRQKLDAQTAMTVAEAAAKIWLGNAVTVRGDGYSVIREGLSRFIATQFIESKYGRDVADLERLRQRTAYAAVAKRDSPLSAVSPLDDYYFTSNANKGAMIWRLLAKKIGADEFFNALRANMKDGSLDLGELRAAFSAQKDFLDSALDQVTDTNLLVGLPQTSAGETKIALRNTGSIDATVSVNAVAANGEKLSAQATIPAKNFGEVTFKTTNKIVRTEVDAEKFYPQTDYFDDVAPRQFDESDLLLSVKKAFDKQDYVLAEKNARAVLQSIPIFDDVRILLGRALLAQGKNADAEKEFQAVFNEKLPTARSLAWANVGLGEIALKAGQNAAAAKYFEAAIRTDAEYGADLIAWQGRNKINTAGSIDESVKAYFTQFDKTVVSNRKADIDAIVSTGDVVKFASGISGQTERWQTQILATDKIDANNILVEANLNIKLLNREPESGMAVYRLTRFGSSWKLSGVEMFEVR